jgi:hypothetical protein
MKTKKETKKKPESELFKFAFFPLYNEAIKYLAEKLADKEDEWDFSDIRTNTHAILKNYLEHMFRKLQQEGKIHFTKDNKYACFNTGLVTENWEEIYAFFEQYKKPKNEYVNPPFCFKAFLKKSNRELLTYFHGNLPEIADFFQKPEELIFNPKCELIPEIDHIIEDNKERFPDHMQNCDNAEMRRKLEGAIEEVNRKVKTNYKIAVPQYFNGRIQLLLPLCLTPNSKNPDLALVVHKLNDTTYTARTCLTLKMAYNNARLIVKPQSSWLKP